MVGQFKDDQVQTHKHKYRIDNNAYVTDVGSTSPYMTVGYSNNSWTNDQDGRKGDVTRGKSKGVKYIIKVL